MQGLNVPKKKKIVAQTKQFGCALFGIMLYLVRSYGCKNGDAAAVKKFDNILRWGVWLIQTHLMHVM